MVSARARSLVPHRGGIMMMNGTVRAGRGGVAGAVLAGVTSSTPES